MVNNEKDNEKKINISGQEGITSIDNVELDFLDDENEDIIEENKKKNENKNNSISKKEVKKQTGSFLNSDENKKNIGKQTDGIQNIGKIVDDVKEVSKKVINNIKKKEEEHVIEKIVRNENIKNENIKNENIKNENIQNNQNIIHEHKKEENNVINNIIKGQEEKKVENKPTIDINVVNKTNQVNETKGGKNFIENIIDNISDPVKENTKEAVNKEIERKQEVENIKQTNVVTTTENVVNKNVVNEQQNTTNKDVVNKIETTNTENKEVKRTIENNNQQNQVQTNKEQISVTNISNTNNTDVKENISENNSKFGSFNSAEIDKKIDKIGNKEVKGKEENQDFSNKKDKEIEKHMSNINDNQEHKIRDEERVSNNIVDKQVGNIVGSKKETTEVQVDQTDVVEKNNIQKKIQKTMENDEGKQGSSGLGTAGIVGAVGSVSSSVSSGTQVASTVLEKATDLQTQPLLKENQENAIAKNEELVESGDREGSTKFNFDNNEELQKGGEQQGGMGLLLSSFKSINEKTEEGDVEKIDLQNQELKEGEINGKTRGKTHSEKELNQAIKAVKESKVAITEEQLKQTIPERKKNVNVGDVKGIINSNSGQEKLFSGFFGTLGSFFGKLSGDKEVVKDVSTFAHQGVDSIKDTEMAGIIKGITNIFLVINIYTIGIVVQSFTILYISFILIAIILYIISAMGGGGTSVGLSIGGISSIVLGIGLLTFLNIYSGKNGSDDQLEADGEQEVTE